MSLRFSGAAELGMGDRDQVVHEVDGPDIRLSGPRSITVRVESSMTDVQIEPVLPRATPRPKVPEYTRHQAPAKMLLRTFEQSEEGLRGPGVEDASKMPVLDDGLGPMPEMAQIGEADAIDAGRETTLPATPDQARDIQQKGGVVGHCEGLGANGRRCNRMFGRLSAEAQCPSMPFGPSGRRDALKI